MTTVKSIDSWSSFVEIMFFFVINYKIITFLHFTCTLIYQKWVSYKAFFFIFFEEYRNL